MLKDGVRDGPASSAGGDVQGGVGSTGLTEGGGGRCLGGGWTVTPGVRRISLEKGRSPERRLCIAIPRL